MFFSHFSSFAFALCSGCYLSRVITPRGCCICQDENKKYFEMNSCEISFNTLSHFPKAARGAGEEVLSKIFD